MHVELYSREEPAKKTINKSKSRNHKSVCIALDMKSSNVSAIFRKLKEKDVLVFDDEKNMYINSNLVMKGLKHRLAADKRENLKKSQVENDLFDRSY